MSPRWTPSSWNQISRVLISSKLEEDIFLFVFKCKGVCVCLIDRSPTHTSIHERRFAGAAGATTTKGIRQLGNMSILVILSSVSEDEDSC